MDRTNPHDDLLIEDAAAGRRVEDAAAGRRGDVAVDDDAAARRGEDDEYDDVEYETSRPRSLVVAAWALVISGAVGLIGSVALLMERLALLGDASYIPQCNVNAVLSCGSVIESWQASVLGDLPNPVLGIMGFPIVIVTGVVVLAGARLPDWYWGAFLGGTLCAVAFIHWLAWQSFFVIGALCPYCMVVWLATMCAMAAILVAMAAQGHYSRGLIRWMPIVVVAWVAMIIILAFARFGSAVIA